MPPPPPPPGPPPPPAGPAGGRAGPASRSAPAPSGNGRSDLLKSIQQGKALKKAVTNDRSAPIVGDSKPKPSAAAAPLGSSRSPASSASASSLPGRAGNQAGSAQANSASTSRLPGIGGLFSDGIPTLKKTSGGVSTGRKPEAAQNLPSPQKLNFGNSNGLPAAAPTPQNTSGSRGNGHGTTANGSSYGSSNGGSSAAAERNYFNRSTSSSSIQAASFTSSSLDFVRNSHQANKHPQPSSNKHYDSIGTVNHTSSNVNNNNLKWVSPSPPQLQAPQQPSSNKHYGTVGTANHTSSNINNLKRVSPSPPQQPPLARATSVGKLVSNFEVLDVKAQGEGGEVIHGRKNSRASPYEESVYGTSRRKGSTTDFKTPFQEVGYGRKGSTTDFKSPFAEAAFGTVGRKSSDFRGLYDESPYGTNGRKVSEVRGPYEEPAYGTLGRKGFRGPTSIQKSYKPPLTVKPMLRHTNSTPSLTPPSASPAPSLKSNAPPPPPANYNTAKRPVHHPNAKPPPPPVPQGSQQAPASWTATLPPPKPPHSANFGGGNSNAVMRTKSFNQVVENGGNGLQRAGSRDDSSLANSAPAPPVRTVSQAQSMRRPGGPAPAPPAGGGQVGLQRGQPPQRVAPMKPPSAPPPPPPTSHPPPPPHRMQPAPQPNHMESNFVSDPPTPPARRQSIRNGHSSGYNSSSSNSGGESFEARFQGRFKTPQFLPPPEPFTNCPKTYPSRNQQQLSGRQGSMVKRTPAPPPPSQQQQQQQQVQQQMQQKVQQENRSMWSHASSRC